jgi:ComF family protein
MVLLNGAILLLNRVEMRYLNALISLIFPRVCLACGEALLQHEKTVCTLCYTGLPYTDFHILEENPVINQFLGKIDFYAGTSMFYFSKGGKIQHLIHQLKYRGRKEVGEYMGELYGKSLVKSPLYKDIDYIIPVPLHAAKLKKRGYNQAECFADGLSVSMQVPVDIKTLYRAFSSETQTRKKRFHRWENVRSIFALNNYAHLENKHVLLVDDVITTGSTLEAAGHVLKTIPGIKISVCSIGYAV